MKKIFIGIDFSKEKFDATLIKAEGLKECAPSMHEVFDNKTSGFRRLVRWVKAQSEGLPIDTWIFCGENTGAYSIGLSNYLYASGYDMCLECAYKIKHSAGILRAKNDKTDSMVIAEYAMRNYDKIRLHKPQSSSLTCLREVFLYRHSLVREINKAIYKCDQKIKETIAADDELREIFDIITSMPGIGIQNATCLMVYTDNFQKFDMDSRKIACYYGIAPFGRQSGTSVNSRPKVSPFANRMIKALLSQAALAAIKSDISVHNYYQRLIERGKHPLLIHNNIKNKMLHALVVYQTNKSAA